MPDLDPASPVRHKKTTSDIDIKEKDPSEMFLIRDQDTGKINQLVELLLKAKICSFSENIYFIFFIFFCRLSL